MYNQDFNRKLTFWDKVDIPVVGFVIGVIVPFVTYLIIYNIQFNHLPFKDFYEISLMKNTAPTLLRTMVFPNLPIFLIFNIFKKFLICRGIFIATILFIGAMLMIKYL